MFLFHGIQTNAPKFTHFSKVYYHTEFQDSRLVRYCLCHFALSQDRHVGM